MLTKEQALDRLLKVEQELSSLLAEKKSLRAIVLGETLPPVSPPIRHARNDSLSEQILKILKDNGPSTAKDVMILGSLPENATYQALRRLKDQGFLNRSGTGGNDDPYKWELAIHLDNLNGAS